MTAAVDFMWEHAFHKCENKDADQLCSNCTADQRLCFHFTDSTIPFLLQSEISVVWPAFVAVQAGLCQTLSKKRNIDFYMARLIYDYRCRFHVVGRNVDHIF